MEQLTCGRENESEGLISTGYFRCEFPGCNIKRKVISQKNGEVETMYEKYVVDHHQGPNASFFFFEADSRFKTRICW